MNVEAKPKDNAMISLAETEEVSQVTRLITCGWTLGTHALDG
jgi:hypothetical protein